MISRVDWLEVAQTVGAVLVAAPVIYVGLVVGLSL